MRVSKAGASENWDESLVVMTGGPAEFSEGAESVAAEPKQTRASMKCSGAVDSSEKIDEVMIQKADNREAAIAVKRVKNSEKQAAGDPKKPGSTDVPDDDNPAKYDGLRRRKGQ